MGKIDKYIFIEICKGCLLVFFIFISVSWLLQFTRLISLTNLIQVDILTILYLSLFLIPNLASIIMPFVIMFGLIITFIKLHKDRELISIFTLGLNIKSILRPMIIFSLILLSLLIILNFYVSPKIYKNYKIKEHEIRNKINFEKIVISNFIEINKNTFLDFKKEGNKFKEVFIKFIDEKDNMIFSSDADIIQKDDKFKFILNDGFKITLLENNKIEKLEFDNYTLEITNSSYQKYDNFDNNTFNIFEDLKNKNYINILFKTTDSLIIIIIIIYFYYYNIRDYKLNVKNLLTYSAYCSGILIINQILKNSELSINLYIMFIILFSLFFCTYLFIGKNNVKN